MKFYSQHQTITLESGPTRLDPVEDQEGIFSGDASEEEVLHLEEAGAAYQHLEAFTTEQEDFEEPVVTEVTPASSTSVVDKITEVIKKTRGGRPPRKPVETPSEETTKSEEVTEESN